MSNGFKAGNYYIVHEKRRIKFHVIYITEECIDDYVHFRYVFLDDEGNEMEGSEYPKENCFIDCYKLLTKEDLQILKNEKLIRYIIE